MCKVARRREGEMRRIGILEEMWAAWRGRNLAEVNRLAMLAAGSKVGPKKRSYRTLKGAMPTSEQWQEVWSKAGCEGGMEVEPIDWEQYVNDTIGVAPARPRWRREARWQAMEDIKRTRKYVIKAPKRRAVPKGSVPVELLVMCMSPNWRMDFAGQGLGAPRGKITNPWFRRALLGGFTLIRLASRTPLAWHRSVGWALPKSSTPGPKGKRVVHMLEPLGKAWYAGRIDARDPEPVSHMDHGFHKYRRKEGAVLVQLNISWRLRRLGWSHLQCNMDMTNAFASTEWSSLREANKDLRLEVDQEVGRQRFECAVVDLPTDSGSLTVKTGCGALMGDPFAVHSFGGAFKAPVGRWQMGQGEFDDCWEELWATCPAVPGGLTVDLGITKYADDVVRTNAIRPGGTLQELADKAWKSSDLLDTCLEPVGLAQNRSKQVAVVSLVGDESKRAKRMLRSGEVKLPGVPREYTRSLGAQVSAKANFHPELVERVAATRRAFHSVGKFWTMGGCHGNGGGAC